MVNVTDPASPSYASHATDGMNGFEGLAYAYKVVAAHIGGHPYALVVSINDDALQVVNLTDPANPRPAGLARNGTGGFTTLDFPLSLAVTEIAGRHYALVGGTENNNQVGYKGHGVQIIDVTDPATPWPAAAVQDDFWLGVPTAIGVVQEGGRHYALAFFGNRLVVIDITDPTDPEVVARKVAGPVAAAAATGNRLGEFGNVFGVA